MANFDTDVLEFVPPLFWVFYIYNIEDNLVANAFCIDLLGYIYSHLIFFYFFCPDPGVLLLGARSRQYQISNVFFDKHRFDYAWPYRPFQKANKLLPFDLLVSSTDSKFFHHD